MDALYRHRNAIVDWFEKFGVTHHVTLVTNWDRPTARNRNPNERDDSKAKMARVTTAFWRWQDRIQRALSGRNWRARSDRAAGMAFVEHAETNIHWHVLVRVPPSSNEWLLWGNADHVWQKIVPGGNALVQPFDGDSKLFWYATKDILRSLNSDNIQPFGTRS